MKKHNTFVILGNSAAGLACIESIREKDRSAKIINISQETHPPYSRCLLSYYLAGQINKDGLWIRPPDYYKDLNVEPILGAQVTHIDDKNRILKLADGRPVNFDKLLFATGGSPKRVNIKGTDKKGVFYLRTIDDAEGIYSMLAGVRDVVVLGGGLIGLRAAYSLSRQGKEVHVIVKSSHVFSQILDLESADMIRMRLQQNGIQIRTGLEAVEILGKDKVEGVLLDDGNRLECQLVIIGKGVSSNVDLLKGKVNINEGVLVDEHLKTSLDSIYAAGDVAEAFDMLEERPAINAIWPAAVSQGKIAGLNMAGTKLAYEGSCRMNSIDFFGIACISFGIVRPKAEGFKELIQADFSRNIYRKVVLKNNKIVGAIFVGDVEKHGILLNLALQRIDISDIEEILADEYFDYGKIIPLIKRQKEKFLRPEYQDTCLSYSTL
jgi:NAD(P)H-nitrite reductase large subunit